MGGYDEAELTEEDPDVEQIEGGIIVKAAFIAELKQEILNHEVYLLSHGPVTYRNVVEYSLDFQGLIIKYILLVLNSDLVSIPDISKNDTNMALNIALDLMEIYADMRDPQVEENIMDYFDSKFNAARDIFKVINRAPFLEEGEQYLDIAGFHRVHKTNFKSSRNISNDVDAILLNVRAPIDIGNTPELLLRNARLIASDFAMSEVLALLSGKEYRMTDWIDYMEINTNLSFIFDMLFALDDYHNHEEEHLFREFFKMFSFELRMLGIYLDEDIEFFTDLKDVDPSSSFNPEILEMLEQSIEDKKNQQEAEGYDIKDILKINGMLVVLRELLVNL